MRITNEVYTCCPSCGVEAHGLEDINKVFGYKIVKKDIMPYSKCRKCRGDDLEFEGRYHKKVKDKQWATAASWGRLINISRTVFDSYLIELGYLEYDDNASRTPSRLSVTIKGSSHSATTNSMFGKMVLWDYETYLEVAKLRIGKAIIHDVCPRCKSYLDTMPGYNDVNHGFKCKRCGRECGSWYVKVIHDR